MKRCVTLRIFECQEIDPSQLEQYRHNLHTTLFSRQMQHGRLALDFRLLFDEVFAALKHNVSADVLMAILGGVVQRCESFLVGFLQALYAFGFDYLQHSFLMTLRTSFEKADCFGWLAATPQGLHWDPPVFLHQHQTLDIAGGLDTHHTIRQTDTLEAHRLVIKLAAPPPLLIPLLELNVGRHEQLFLGGLAAQRATQGSCHWLEDVLHLGCLHDPLLEFRLSLGVHGVCLGRWRGDNKLVAHQWAHRQCLVRESLRHQTESVLRAESVHLPNPQLRGVGLLMCLPPFLLFESD